MLTRMLKPLASMATMPLEVKEVRFTCTSHIGWHTNIGAKAFSVGH